MRWLGWATAVSFLLLVNSAITYAGCASCGGSDMGSYRSYRGSACYSPPGYCLAPGCCECPPSACDNAWDGYCEEKAKWQAFFTRVGTPRVYCHGCPAMVPAETCNNSPTNFPTSLPIMEPQPTLAPKASVSSSPYSPVMSPSSPYSPVMSPGRATSKTDGQWYR
ncbi:MAG: hypothetical protein ABSE63_15160 [Thermoguttaceae bacterium]|jgi:hypothetical protein